MNFRNTFVMAFALGHFFTVDAQYSEVESLYKNTSYYSFPGGKIDLNNDGDLDYVYQEEGKVYWTTIGDDYEYHGKNLIDIAPYESIFQYADWDNDGMIDFIVKSNGKFRWISSKDNGKSFSDNFIDLDIEKVLYRFVDLNGDQHLDAYNSNSVSFNNGDGTFTFRADAPDYRRYAPIDVDNDGDMDLGIYNQSGIYYVENDGAGNFTHKLLLNKGSYTSYDDYNNDGFLDFILKDYSGKYLYLNDGSNNFVVTAPPNWLSIDAPKVIDLDNDGQLDIVGLDADVWYKNNNGVYTLQQEVGLHEYASSYDRVDLNNDGIYEIMGRNNNLYYGGYGQVWQQKERRNDDVEYDHNFTFVDLNGDGIKDILSHGGSYSSIAFGDQNHEFSEPSLLTNHHFYWFNGFLVKSKQIIGDVDHDGDIDILNYLDDDLYWLLNDGNGNFSASVPIATFYSPDQSIVLVVVDYNDDTWLDVIVSNNEGGLDLIENNNGAGYLAPVNITSSSTGYIQALEFCELDGDNEKELFSMRLDRDGFYDVETQQLSAENILATTNYYGNDYKKHQIIDIENDTDADILVFMPSYVTSESTISLHENNGLGSFATKDITPDNLSVHGFGAGDLNNDDYADLVVVASDGIYEYINDGYNNFELNLISTMQLDSVYSVQIFDFDEDGDNDIFISSESFLKEGWGSLIKIENESKSITSSKEIRQFAQAKIYPNPMENYFNINFNEELNGEFEMSLMDMTGKKVYSELISGDMKTHFEVPNLAKGTYMPVIQNLVSGEKIQLELLFVK